MGTIEISTLLSYLVMPLLAYNGWLHVQVINAQREIAVNSAMDAEIIKQFDNLQTDFKAMSKELHDFMIKYSR